MGFSNLRVGVKLGVAFIAMVLLSTVIGGLAILQLGHINNNTRDIATNWLPSVQALGDMRATANRLRAGEVGLVLTADPAQKMRLEQDVKNVIQLFAGQEKRYAEMVTDEEVATYNTFKTQRDAYLAVNAQLVGLAQEGEARYADATRLLYAESQTTFVAMAESIGKLSKINADGAERAFQQSQASFNMARGEVLGALVAAIVIAVVLGLWITRLITGPVSQAMDATREIAQGNLTVHLAVRGEDELGRLTRSLIDMRDNLARVVSGVRSNADSVALASAEIAQGNNDLSARTEQQASALEETAASMEELGSTVRQNADNARQANQLAMSASTVAEQGGQVVAEVVDTMKGITDSSRKISDIIGVIDGIAFQTNILALNAAVEAARAGEQGRGFAVVAGEVRSLAQRSAEAAKEIKGLITTSVERVEQGTVLVDKAGTTMTEVVTAIRRVTDIMGEISAASSEQSQGVAQVGEAITQMDQATQQNAALVEESAAAASNLKTQAAQLVEAVAVFRLAQDGAGVRLAPPVAAPRSLHAPTPAPAAKPAAAPRVASKPAPSVAAAPARAPAPRATPAPLPAPKPAPRAASTSDDDWETF